jgi:hypothetical protein
MTKGKRLELWEREDFVKLYKIVKYHPERPKKKWSNIAEASREFGVSDTTIAQAIEMTKGVPPPEKAKIVAPKWIQKYEQTELYKKLQKDYPDPRDPSQIDKQGKRVSVVGETLYHHSDPKLYTFACFYASSLFFPFCISFIADLTVIYAYFAHDFACGFFFLENFFGTFYVSVYDIEASLESVAVNKRLRNIRSLTLFRG